MYKYVCAIKNFPNCRVHDTGEEQGLRFFKDMEDVKRELANSYQWYEYGDIYSIEDGSKFARVIYNFNRHEFRSIELHSSENGGIYISNGYNQFAWKTWDEYREHSI